MQSRANFETQLKSLYPEITNNSLFLLNTLDDNLKDSFKALLTSIYNQSKTVINNNFQRIPKLARIIEKIGEETKQPNNNGGVVHNPLHTLLYSELKFLMMGKNDIVDAALQYLHSLGTIWWGYIVSPKGPLSDVIVLDSNVSIPSIHLYIS